MLFSGLTVVFALLGLLIIPHAVFVSLGLGAISVVTVAVLAGLTLLPAVLSVMGDKVDRFSIRIPGRKKSDGGEGPKYWDRFARIVMRFPVISLIAGVGLLVAASISYFDINTGSSGVSTFPDDFRAKQGFEVLQQDFGFGLDAPAEIVITATDVRAAPIQEAIQKLTSTLTSDDRFGPADLEINDDGDLALLAVPLEGDPTSEATSDAVERLRERYIPEAFSGVPEAEVLVGGQTAENNDFNEVALTYQPVVIALVLSLSFLLLMVVFRSIVIPVASIIMNLLSVGAAYGLLVLVFQKGYGNEVFGFPQTEVIQAWMPLMLFTILFGLSMDYQVFLLSRIREQYDKTGVNSESVVYGVTSTAGLITGAALIMVAVFGGFAAGKLEPLQQFGFGMAVAVLVDATLVRSILVPATMKLLGDRNWYLPRFLKWLPDVRVEGGPATESAGVGDD